MFRKLIKHGESSLTITLPMSFVKEFNLKKGEQIDVQEVNNGLFVSAKPYHETKTVSIDLSNKKGIIPKILGATYKCGYNEVHITYSSYDELKIIKEILQSQFEGFEILKETKSNLTIKKISQDSYEQFPQVLRRFFLVINHMSEDCFNASKSKDFNWLKTTSLLKYNSDKLADFCRRAINDKHKTEYKRLSPLYVVVEQTEKISDEYQKLCLYLADNKVSLSKECLNLLSSLNEYQKEFYHLFFKFDLSKVKDLVLKCKRLDEEIKSVLNKCEKNEVFVMLSLNNINQIISNLNGPLMGCFV